MENEIELVTNPNVAQVFKKVMNRVMVMGVFTTDAEAERYVKAFSADTMELLIHSPIGESMPLKYIVPFNTDLLKLS